MKKIYLYLPVVGALVWGLFLAILAGSNLQTFHIDGAFQTASTLYRLHSEQVIAQDFQAYLGIGLSYLLYPLFWLLGADFSASQMSAQLITFMGGLGLYAVIWRFTVKNTSAVSSLRIAFIAFVLPQVFLTSMGLQENLNIITTFYSHPGVSLRPVRSMLPVILAVVFWFIHSRYSKNIVSTISGVMSGLALLWTNDYAYTTTLLFSLLVLVYLIRGERSVSKIIALICMYAFTALTVYIFSLGFLTNWHILDFFKYNFVDVRGDQFWYFTPYDEDLKVLSFLDIYKIFTFSVLPLIGVLGVVVSMVRAAKDKTVQNLSHLFIGLSFLASGFLASVGGHLYFQYFAPVATYSILTILYILWDKLEKEDWRNSALSYTTIFAVLVISATCYRFISLSNEVYKNPDYIYVDELGGYLESDWAEYVEFARETRGKQVTEEYWGVYSAINYQHGSFGVDSVIHALGEARIKASESIPSNEFIITTRNSISEIDSRWVDWNKSTNYWLYEQLLSGWDVYKVFKTTVVWKKKDVDLNLSEENKTHNCEYIEAKNKIGLNNKDVGAIELSFDYTFEGGGRRMLLVENGMTLQTGYLTSVNPSATNTKLMVNLLSEDEHLKVKTVTSGKSFVEINNCRYRFLNVPDPISTFRLSEAEILALMKQKGFID